MTLSGTVLPYLLAGISVGGQYALIAIGYTASCALSTSPTAMFSWSRVF